ncbi:MAG TPA: TIGR03435 family protein [Bryobacteraceae bacterium]|nr:TIGR03435 family protein [Bryobacteraceae bacterium]
MSVTGQAQPRSAFDVASVKAVDLSTLGDSISMNLGTVRNGEITFGNATLSDCVRFAYGIASDAQISGLAWIKSKRYLYNVDAKAAPGAASAQLQAMMQTLLAERFKVVAHREQREMPYYAVGAAKGGVRMQAVKEVPDGFRGTNFGGRINNIMPMPKLAYLLSRFETERPIIDETGLDGMYEVKLTWTLRPLQNANPDDATEISLFTALEQQLGLRLEARKGAVDVLVVDGAEMIPSGN